MSIESTLEERGNRYGSFEHHAQIAQDLQQRMQQEAGWLKLAPDQRQALTVIADKIARMLNGDPTYRDNWHDIVGYAKLVDDRMALNEERQAQVAKTKVRMEALDSFDENRADINKNEAASIPREDLSSGMRCRDCGDFHDAPGTACPSSSFVCE